ncbi:MAG: hypothetical protein DA408_11250 [Bacteroidetes bacterium]|nr:MAG: hypothetical protein C7N36_14175 [Bacteroidota bacterium]PTM12251.1 MAG: hypothetical protein DA408_11250 [Bacteroidota bacterium]
MLVTIIIPTYNAAAYVARALDSALAQTYAYTEIICVDNNSTDHTLELLTQYQSRFPDKIQVLQEFVQGAPAARNLGLAHAKGEWVQFLDADDELLPGKLIRQSNLIKHNTQLILGTPIIVLENSKYRLELWPDIWKGLGHVSHCGQTSANLYNSKVLRKIKGWDEKITNGQDTDLLLRLLQNEVKVIQDHRSACYYHTDAKDRITKKNPEQALISHIHISGRLSTYLKQNLVQYWNINATFFYMATYHHLRMLACLNPELAGELYLKYIPADFQLKPSEELRIPYWDCMGVNVLGLTRFARIRNKAKILIPDKLWTGIKKIINE